MKKGLLIICDREEAYARRLMEYLSRKESFFEICIFTGMEMLLGYMASHRADILLIEEELMDGQVEAVMPGRIILLSEGSKVAEGGKYSMIYKFQPAEAVEKEIMNFYALQGGRLAADEAVEQSRSLWCVFSPAGGCGKTAFALALGQWLAREKQVLYLSLESFGSLMPEGGQQGMTDLLYYTKERKENLFMVLGSLAEKRQGLDCILPVDCCKDLELMDKGDLDYLLEALEKSCYERIILDIGFINKLTFYLLSKCSRIFMPRRGEEDIGKMSAMERSIRMEGKEELLGRMEKFLLPEAHSPEMERFLWKLLKED